MLEAYVEQSAQKPGFFTQFFQSPERNFFTQEKVEIDIRRSGNQIAPVLTTLGADLHRTESRKLVNKEFVPAVYGEEFGLGVKDAMKRQLGQDPFQDLGYLRALQTAFTAEMTERETMIRGGIELQASQVLRTGTLSLPGVTGATAFTLDYQPKTTHFPGAETDWDENNVTTRVKDVRSLCNVVHQDGNHRPKYLVFGELALQSWLADAEVKEQLRKDGTGIGEQVPPQLREGGVFHGRVSVGQFQLEMWTAPGIYSAISNGATTKYLNDWEVMVLSEGARLDLVFGDIPILAPDPRVSALSLGRVSSSAGKIDLITNAWVTPNGRNIFGSVEARPLCIPTSIDTFGCLNAKVS
jgi:hypothetical protein